MYYLHIQYITLIISLYDLMIKNIKQYIHIGTRHGSQTSRLEYYLIVSINITVFLDDAKVHMVKKYILYNNIITLGNTLNSKHNS